MSFGYLIGTKRRKLGLSLAKLGEKCGMHRVYIHRIEKGDIKQPSLDTIKKIAEGLGCHYIDLLPDGVEPGSLYEEMLAEKDQSGSGRIVTLPLLNSLDGFPNAIADTGIDGHISLPNVPAGSYAIIISGDSMSPILKNGDYAVFVQENIFDDKTIVVALDRWGDFMIKRYRRKNNEEFLVSENPEYPVINIDNQITVCGRVHRAWRELPV